MRFATTLLEKLISLKAEFDAGIVPEVIYEEMCRQLVASYGSEAFLSKPSPPGKFITR
jgi:hypothetical protein